MSKNKSDAKRSDGLLTTGDMARLTGSSLRTVRFYEEAGILRPSQRTSGGHRLYTHRELERLYFIGDLRSSGMSVDSIRELLELKGNASAGGVAAKGAREIINGQITTLEEKIGLLSRVLDELKRASRMLDDCAHCEDSRFPLECGDCGVVRCRPDVPMSMRVLWSLDSADDAS